MYIQCRLAKKHIQKFHYHTGTSNFSLKCRSCDNFRKVKYLVMTIIFVFFTQLLQGVI